MLLDKADITLTQLAKEINCSEGILSRYGLSKYKSHLKENILSKLIEYFYCSMEYLTGAVPITA